MSLTAYSFGADDPRRGVIEALDALPEGTVVKTGRQEYQWPVDGEGRWTSDHLTFVKGGSMFGKGVTWHTDAAGGFQASAAYLASRQPVLVQIGRGKCTCDDFCGSPCSRHSEPRDWVAYRKEFNDAQRDGEESGEAHRTTAGGSAPPSVVPVEARLPAWLPAEVRRADEVLRAEVGGRAGFVLECRKGDALRLAVQLVGRADDDRTPWIPVEEATEKLLREIVMRLVRQP